MEFVTKTTQNQQTRKGTGMMTRYASSNCQFTKCFECLENWLTESEIFQMSRMSPRVRLQFQKAVVVQDHKVFGGAKLPKSFRAQLQVGSYNPLNLLWNANDALTGVSQATEVAQTTLTNISETVTSGREMASETLGKIQGAIAQVTESIGAVMAPSKLDLVAILTKVLQVIVNVALAAPGRRITSLFFNIFVEFGKQIFDYVLSFFKAERAHQMLYDARTETVTAVLQADGVPEGEDSSIWGLLSEYIPEDWTLSPSVLGSVIGSAVLGILGFGGLMDAKDTIKFFGERCRSFTNMIQFGNVAVPLFTSIGDFICQTILGRLPAPSELDAFLDGYTKWCEEVYSVCLVTDPALAVRLEKDKSLVFKIQKLYKSGVDYALQLGQKKITGECTLHYHKVFKMIESAQKACDYTGVFGNRPRTKPAVIQLFGESGVGKSGMSWPLSCDLNAAMCSDLESARNFAKEIYFRNTEQEFWDGYAGQNVVVYDDFGQRGDSQTAPNEEFMELIRAANLAPYPLHMASLEEKRRTKFCSRVIILTSNVLNHKVNSLTFPDAYRRRIDICGKVINKEEYTKEGCSLTTGATVKRLDGSKCDGPCDTSPYLVQMYNAESLQPICNSDGSIVTLEYEEFLIEALKAVKKAHSESVAMNTRLEERIDDRRFRRLRAALQGDDCGGILHIPGEDELSGLHGTVVEPERVDKWTNFKRLFKSSLTGFYQNLTAFKIGLIAMVGMLSVFGIWKMFDFGKKKTRKRSYSPCTALNKPCASCTSNHPVFGITGCSAAVERWDDALAGRTDAFGLEAGSSGDHITRQRQINRVEAAVSGDPKTVSRPVKVVEASVSGDPVTRKAKTSLVEASVSGDSRTRRPVMKIVEASVSGDPTTKKQKTVVVEAVEAELEAWKDATAQELITHRVLSNMYKLIRVRSNEPDLAVLNGLFVRDNIMLVPRHLENYMRSTDELRLENIFGVTFQVPYSILRREYIEASAGFHKDAMLVRFNRQVNAHSDIVKHFQSMPELAQKRVDVCIPTLRCVDGRNIVTILGNTMAQMEHIELVTDAGTFNIRDCVRYTLNTIGGDCGGPIICNENSFIRKIAGIHIAGQKDGRASFGQSVTRADLERTLVKFDKVVTTDFDLLANFSVSRVDLQGRTEWTREELMEALYLPAENCNFVGGCSRPPFAPNETDIRPSVIHGLVHEPTTKPSILRRRDVNMLHKNIAKCFVNTPYIPENEVKEAVADVKALLLSGRDKKRLARVLTFEEAIAGSTDSEFIGAISRSSSAGYPWVLDRPAGKPGKTGWLGDDQTFLFDDTVRRVVEQRISDAKLGLRHPVVWTATLKDERRPIEKVDALKTRVFATGPMDYLIAVRMYFLGFVAHIMENRVANEQSIGTNPFGLDWTRTAKRLSRFGEKVFAGDFSTFDGTLNSAILSEFVEVANAFYDDGPDNAMIREVLMLDVYNSTWLCDGVYIGLNHSQPSGNPLTTILNSFYNSVSMRIAYKRCARTAGIVAPPFQEVVSMVSYGDDNVINFSDSIAEWFNQITVTDAYASFGMTYTDEAKTGELVAHRKLEEVAYLKRGFLRDGCIWRAPMSLVTLHETPNWVRKSPDGVSMTLMNVEDVCMELAQHPREVFEAEVKALCDCFYETTGLYPTVSTFDTYRETWNREMGLSC